MPSNTRSRVLCVDDDEDACEMISILMKAYDIDATCVRTAAEVWPVIEAESFDLYILDGWLPKLDGFELCRQIRVSDSKTPILFYSGAAYEADRQKGIAAGANAYVSKPDLEGLIETITGLLAKAAADNVAPRWVSSPSHSAENWLSSQFFVAGTVSD